jgi:multiple sugar transport system ATP-binding protein
MKFQLEIKGITKFFGEKKILSCIDLKVKKGDFCILLGPSGCGKTTLLRIIAGLESPTDGNVFLEGKEVTHLSPKARDIAMVFQSYALYPHMKVFDNMAFPLKLKGLSKETTAKKVDEVSKLLGIEELLQRRPAELSGGQRQRVAIGRAIVREPTLFLFDEPLSNLDAQLRADMRVELTRLHKTLGTTVLYVTHDQVEAMTLGKTIVILKDGFVQQIGTPENIYTKPANIFVAGFVGTPSMNFLKGMIRKEGDNLFFISPCINVMIDRGLLEYDGEEVVCGIRPEDIDVKDMLVSDSLQAIAEIVEDMGSEKLLYLSGKEGLELIVRVPPSTICKEGTKVSFSFNPQKLHFFKNDQRIEY